MKVNIGKFPKHSHQKIKVEIERHDTWNMAHTLAYIVYPMLLKLREEKQGIPSEFADVGGEDYHDQRSFDFYAETVNKSFEEKCKEWDVVLEKIIWSFEQLIDDDWEQSYHHGKHETDWEETEKSYSNPITGKVEKLWKMVDKNPGGHWYDYDGHMLHQARMQEGFELFGKYFQNLWD